MSYPVRAAADTRKPTLGPGPGREVQCAHQRKAPEVPRTAENDPSESKWACTLRVLFFLCAAEIRMLAAIIIFVNVFIFLNIH